LLNMVEQQSIEEEHLYDFQITFTEGMLGCLIHCNYLIHWPRKNSYKIPIETSVKIQKFIGTLRICWIPSNFGLSWFSFVGHPIIEYDIQPKVGESKFQM